MLLLFGLFWLLGLSLLWRTVYAIAGSSYLEIDSSSFRLGWKCLCFGDQVQGQRADIVGIERGSKDTLTIREKKHKHEFAAEVTPVEKDWLEAEVSDFLKGQSSQKS